MELGTEGRHSPYPEVLMYQVNRVGTICEELRGAYICVFTGNVAGALRHIRVAVTMAKKMDGKLREYKRDWDVDFWDRL